MRDLNEWVSDKGDGKRSQEKEKSLYCWWKTCGVRSMEWNNILSSENREKSGRSLALLSAQHCKKYEKQQSPGPMASKRLETNCILNQNSRKGDDSLGLPDSCLHSWISHKPASDSSESRDKERLRSSGQRAEQRPTWDPQFLFSLLFWSKSYGEQNHPSQFPP